MWPLMPDNLLEQGSQGAEGAGQILPGSLLHYQRYNQDSEQAKPMAISKDGGLGVLHSSRRDMGGDYQAQ